MTIQMLKPSTQHGDHHFLSLRVSHGADGTQLSSSVPPSTSAWELCTLVSFCPSLPTLHKQATAILLAQTSVFSPFSFHAMSCGRKVMTDQGKGHVCCLHLSLVQVHRQPSEKSKGGDYHAKGHQHLAPMLKISSKGFGTLRHLLSHIETALTFSP